MTKDQSEIQDRPDHLDHPGKTVCTALEDIPDVLVTQGRPVCLDHRGRRAIGDHPETLDLKDPKVRRGREDHKVSKDHRDQQVDHPDRPDHKVYRVISAPKDYPARKGLRVTPGLLDVENPAQLDHKDLQESRVNKDHKAEGLTTSPS